MMQASQQTVTTDAGEAQKKLEKTAEQNNVPLPDENQINKKR